MFISKYSYPIGIDIGAHEIYAAQLRETRQGFSVRALVHQELKVKSEDNEEVDEALSLLEEALDVEP